tara:strand:- start:141902 stop:142411 length:510 start_codon:yes stop_codon:yes gene_type:complete
MSTTTRSAAKGTSTAKAAKASKPGTSARKSPAAVAKKSTAASPVSPPKDAPVSPLGSQAAPASATATPTVVDAPQSVILGPVLRKKELIDSVVARSGIKKKDAKPVVEAMLEVLGEALGENRELILPPFGRIKVRKERMMPNGRVLITKIRQAAPGEKAKSDDGDDSDD